MTIKSKNIINKLVIELQLPGSENQRDENSDNVKVAVLDGIYSFDRNFSASFSDQIYRTEQVQINISIDRDKRSNIAAEVVRQLKEHFLQQGAPRLQFQNDRKPGSLTEVTRLTERQKNEELLLYFLLHGFSPWWADSPDMMKVTDTLLAESSPDFWELKLRPLLVNKPVVVERIAKQFTDESYLRILFLATGDESAANSAGRFVGEVENFLKERPDPFSYGFTEKIIAILKIRLLNYLLEKKEKFTRSSESQLIEVATAVLLDNVPEVTSYEWTEFIKGTTEKKRQKWANIAEKKIKARTGKPETNITEIDKKEELKTIAASPVEGVYNVSQAGLVLLHPFMSRLFEKTGYLKDGLFRSDEVRERAVCLLHYLSAGESEYPEPELLLPMHLCSWPAGIPVNRFLTLSKYEKEECSRLLKSAIEHWQALKNTTPDGLRVNFLMRNGRLKKGEFGWTLHVEHKTHDVLLNKLPWGISLIKFKWMSEHLTIDWKNSS